MEDGTIRVLDEPWPGAWDEPPWPLVVELSRLLPEGSWSLVGGLMVQTHAMLGGIEKVRSTKDVDSALQLRSGTRFLDASIMLKRAGFEENPDTEFAYNFTRGSDVVDLLIPDLFSEERLPRLFGRPLFPISGGARALMESETVALQRDGAEIARFRTPTLKGAIVLKGGAYQVDSRDPERHLEDGVALLSCVRDPGQIRAGLSKRSRKRVRALLAGLRDNPQVWLSFDPGTQARASYMLEEMIVTFDLGGTHGTPPGTGAAS